LFHLFHGKRAGARHRMAAAGGVAAVVLAVIAGVALRGANLGGPAASSSASAVTAAPLPTGASGRPAAGQAQRAGAAPAGGSGLPAASPAAVWTSAASCPGLPLKSQLAAALQRGGSVIVATGTLTGKSVTADPATAGAPAFYAMTLQSVQTLRGPAVASGSTAWIPGPARGTSANPENSALLAPGGRLFAIAWPTAATRDPVGPALQLAPIVGADVVFTPYGCWELTGLQPDQYQARTPLRPVPGGANFGGEHQAAENGIYTVPLGTVRQVAVSA
jgi:hypothetical protein